MNKPPSLRTIAAVLGTSPAALSTLRDRHCLDQGTLADPDALMAAIGGAGNAAKTMRKLFKPEDRHRIATEIDLRSVRGNKARVPSSIKAQSIQ